MDLMVSLTTWLDEYYSGFNMDGVVERMSENVFQRVMGRAAKDVEFRRRLVRSPVEVLEQEGFVLPEGFQVKFVEETEDTICIPIPPLMEEVEDE